MSSSFVENFRLEPIKGNVYDIRRSSHFRLILSPVGPGCSPWLVVRCCPRRCSVMILESSGQHSSRWSDQGLPSSVDPKTWGQLIRRSRIPPPAPALLPSCQGRVHPSIHPRRQAEGLFSPCRCHYHRRCRSVKPIQHPVGDAETRSRHVATGAGTSQRWSTRRAPLRHQ